MGTVRPGARSSHMRGCDVHGKPHVVHDITQQAVRHVRLPHGLFMAPPILSHAAATAVWCWVTHCCPPATLTLTILVLLLLVLLRCRCLSVTFAMCCWALQWMHPINKEHWDTFNQHVSSGWGGVCGCGWGWGRGGDQQGALGEL
jgi:hypothetical protein